jgi:peroxiredoxin
MIKKLLIFLASGSLLFSADKVETIAVGQKAPDFDLKGVDGKSYSLSSFADKEMLLVIFTCNHCPDARAARGRIKQFYADFKDKGVGLVQIAGNDDKAVRLDELGWSVYGDTEADNAIVAREEGYEFPYLYDGATQSVTAAYGAMATPHAFVLDKDRIVRYTGRLDDMKRKFGKPEKSYIHAAVEAVLKEDTPEPAVTRAVGCSTKWNEKRSVVAEYDKDWKAQSVTLADLDVAGAKALRQNASGNLRLINFWSTSCVPCVMEFPMLVETYRRYQTRPFDFVSVSLDPVEKKDAVLKFLTEQQASLSKFTKPSLEAEKRESNNYIFADANPDPLAEAIDAEWSGALPYTVLIDAEGKVIFRHEGEIEAVALRKAIMKELDKLQM